MESVTNRTKCSQGKVGWVEQLLSTFIVSVLYVAKHDILGHPRSIGTSGTNYFVVSLQINSVFICQRSFWDTHLNIKRCLLWSAYVKETNCKYYLYPTGNMSQPSRILPQSNETLLKSYTKRLKDDVKSILDNFTEIVKSSKVYTKPKFKCLHVFYLLH